MTPVERREHPRYVTDLSAYCYKIKDGVSERHLAEVKGFIGDKSQEVMPQSKVTDISKGGLFLATAAEFLVDSVLIVELVIPDGGGHVTAVGVVRWATKNEETHPYCYGMGINFIYMKKEDWDRIQKYLTTLKK